jgi:hypothetical protein
MRSTNYTRKHYLHVVSFVRPLVESDRPTTLSAEPQAASQVEGALDGLHGEANRQL